MKISDIFRKLADVIDQEQDPGSPDPRLQNPAVLAQVDAGPYGADVTAIINFISTTTLVGGLYIKL